jgi:hypothetical protein
MEYVVMVIVAALLGLIPTKIAQSKGYAFGKWWIYGFSLFIVAIIHVYVLKPKTSSTTGNEGGNVETSAESTKNVLCAETTKA